MFKVSPKGIFYGVVAFFVLYILGSVASNLLNVSLMNSPLSWIYFGTWILPGYLAAKASGKSGVINGALVGVIVGMLVGGMTQLFFSSPPPSVDSVSGIEIGIQLGLSGVVLCGLGGLIWEFRNGSSKRGL